MVLETPICLGESILDKLEEIDSNQVLEINSDTGLELTAAEARIQTISIARNLIDIQIKKGDTVVIYSKPNEKITPIVFACYTIGAAVHFLEMNLQKSVISDRLHLFNPTLIIYELEFKLELYQTIGRFRPKNLKHIICLDSAILHHSLNDEEYFLLPDIGEPSKILATLMFTTNSSGLIAVEKRTQTMLTRKLYSFSQLSSGNKLFCPNLFRIINRGLLIMLPIFYGTQLIYNSGENSNEKILQIIDTFKISYYIDIPESFLEILKTAEETKNSKCLASLKIVYIFGELVLGPLEEYLKKIIPNCSVKNIMYNSKKPSKVLRK